MSMMKLEIPLDILHLVYKLNKTAKIVVKTPYGLTEESVIEDIVEQGTVLGPNLCSVSILTNLFPVPITAVKNLLMQN